MLDGTLRYCFFIKLLFRLLSFFEDSSDDTCHDSRVSDPYSFEFESLRMLRLT